VKRPIALVGSEWWTVNSILDRSDGPCHPPDTVRAALLAALERRE
jgi:hypothetical protein